MQQQHALSLSRHTHIIYIYVFLERAFFLLLLSSPQIIGDDGSNWLSACGMGHYAVTRMPGMSCKLLANLYRNHQTGRFLLWDYGTEASTLKKASSNGESCLWWLLYRCWYPSIAV